MTSHTSDFDSLLSLEDNFYTSGHSSGYPHGELHGLFEGRELGREQSWNLWEEIGYYEGVARVLKVVLQRQGKETSRSMQALEQILILSNSFPSSNDSSSLLSSGTASEEELSTNSTEDIDISAQLQTLRSKYKTVCATLGIRARMSVAAASTKQDTAEGGTDLKQMGMSL